MLRSLIYALTLLHLGPGLAFALLAFGCDEPPLLIGSICSLGALRSFGWLTVGSWLILGVGALSVHLINRVRHSNRPEPRLRLFAFAALSCFGSLVGASAQALAGTQYFFLAIPGALALGWLFVANPSDCECVPGAKTQDASERGAA